MKNKSKLIILFIAVLTFISIRRENLYLDSFSDFFLLNVEALAVPEHSGDVFCYGYGSLDCPISNMKVKGIITAYNIKL